MSTVADAGAPATATDPFTDLSATPDSQSQSQLEESYSTSNHSTQSPSSSTSSGQVQLHLEEPTSEGEETLVTTVDPPNLKVTIANANTNKAEVLTPIVEAPEIPNKKRLNISKSMQNLRKKKEKGGRERANSTSDKPPPLPIAPTAIPKSSSATPATTGPPKATRPPLTSNKSGSFSSFLRKLTGKSSDPSNTNTNPTNEKNSSATLSKRKSMFTPSTTNINTQKAATVSEKPRLAKLNTSSRTILKDVVSTDKSTPTHTTASVVPTPTPAPAPAPAALEGAQKEMDPINIPLPPSPDIASAPSLPPGAAPPVDFSAPAPASLPASIPSSASTPASAPAPAFELAAPVSPVVSSKPASKQEMHSFEGFEIEPEAEFPAMAMASPVSTKTTRTGEVSDVDHSFTVDADADVDTSEEEADIVKPLAPISIQIPKRNGSPPLPSASTTLSSSSESQIVTPTSAVDPSLAPGTVGRDGGRPPAAGVGLGLAELGRKESKWRKSVMGLGSLNGSSKRQTQTQSVKPTPAPISTAATGAGTRTLPASHSRSPTKSRPSPSSAARPQRQQNRVSAIPTTQSTAELAAAARGRMARMNSEEEEMAEAFFMA